MKLQLINVLSESRSFSSSFGINKLKYDDVVGFFYLSNLLLFLYKFYGNHSWSERYASKTKMFGNFTKNRNSETDLYMLAYTLGGNNISYIHNEIVTIRARFDSSKFKNYLSLIMNSSVQKRFFEQYFFSIEQDLRMSNGQFRGYRRMAFNWDTLDVQAKIALIENIKYYIRTFSSTAEILDPVDTFKREIEKRAKEIIKESRDSTLCSASEMYQKMSKDPNELKGSLVGRVAGMYGLGPREFLNYLEDTNVKIVSTSAKIPRGPSLYEGKKSKKRKSKKRKSKKKTVGAGMYGYDAGYSGAGGGSGVAVGEAVVKVPNFNEIMGSKHAESQYQEIAQDFVKDLDVYDTVDQTVIDPHSGEVLLNPGETAWDLAHKQHKKETRKRAVDDLELMIAKEEENELMKKFPEFYQGFENLFKDEYDKEDDLLDLENQNLRNDGYLDDNEEEVEEGILNKINGGKRRIRRKVNVTQREKEV